MLIYEQKLHEVERTKSRKLTIVVRRPIVDVLVIELCKFWSSILAERDLLHT